MKTIVFVILFLAMASTVCAEQPNFVLFIADDISGEDFGCQGHPTIKTPNIDRLAAKGLRVDNAYVTSSSCSPSRCSIITGRYPHNTGAPALNVHLPADQPKFPKLLKKAGYYTLLSGKFHLGDDSVDAFTHISKGKGLGKEEDWVECLQQRPKDKPFFMWLASSDAHTPHKINVDAPKYDPADVVVPPYMYDVPGTRKSLAAYYHEISRFDTFVGRVVEELRQQEVLDNTIIMVVSDNGRPFPRAKTRLYDSGVKTPLIVYYPKLVKAGSVSNSLVSTIDIAPTILELAGLKKDPRIQGRSFTPLLTDPTAVIRDLLFTEHNWHITQAHERGLRMGDYLYIKNNYPNIPHKGEGGRSKVLAKAHEQGLLTEAQQNIFRNPCPEEELFNVRSDPHQINDLANNPKYRETLYQMRGLVELWAKQTGDTIPDDPTPSLKTGQRARGVKHRELPGAAANAEKINHPGPVNLSRQMNDGRGKDGRGNSDRGKGKRD